MILRNLEPDPPDNNSITLFVTSENDEDYNFIKSLAEKVFVHMEKKGGKKIPRNPNEGKTETSTE